MKNRFVKYVIAVALVLSMISVGMSNTFAAEHHGDELTNLMQRRKNKSMKF